MGAFAHFVAPPLRRTCVVVERRSGQRSALYWYQRYGGPSRSARGTLYEETETFGLFEAPAFSPYA
eukprot:10200452-Alexandrium_andersonii.AAC.1